MAFEPGLPKVNARKLRVRLRPKEPIELFDLETGQPIDEVRAIEIRDEVNNVRVVRIELMYQHVNE